MQLLDTLTQKLGELANYVPLEWYTFIGAFVEEVVAPIPSPFVMTSVGSLVATQGRGIWFLLIASAIGAVGKTLGSLLVYWVADKGEDIVVGKFGKLLGVSHKDIEGIGKHLRGDVRDSLILLLIRSLPVIPSSPVSVACGVLKIPLKSFVWTTLVGSWLRNLLYLFIGYEGVAAYQGLLEGVDSIESMLQIFMLGAAAALAGWFYYQRRKESQSLVGRLKQLLHLE